ncbi:MAG: thioredoxin family protein, partial [Sediminibacterium sp.]
MKKTILLSLILLVAQLASAQVDKKIDLYNPFENADSALTIIQAQAAKDGKHVLIQLGGNWCSWCIEFNRFVKSDAQLDSIVKANYLVYHLNYSKENKNIKLLTQFEFPNRFGFPVWVILDSKGKRLHTQNSSYLEKDKSYNKEKVKDFLVDWNAEA